METKTLPFTLKADSAAILAGQIEGYAAVFGNLDGGGDIIHPGAFTKTIAENGGRIKLGWQHSAPFGVTTYIAEVGRDSLPPAVLARAPEASGGLFVRGQADMTTEDADRLKRLASGSVDELSIGYETVKADFAQSGETYIRNIREAKLYEWSPVWVAMNPAAVVTGVKGQDARGNSDTSPHAVVTLAAIDYRKALADLAKDVKEGRRLSSATLAKVKDAEDALRAALDALTDLIAADEPSKSHSPLRLADLDIMTAEVEGLVLKARSLTSHGG